MAGNTLVITLTDEQRKQIHEAAGQNVTGLTLEYATGGALSEEQLDEAVGGRKAGGSGSASGTTFLRFTFE